MPRTEAQNKASQKWYSANREQILLRTALRDADKYNGDAEYRENKLIQMKEYRERVNADENLKAKKVAYMKAWREAKKLKLTKPVL